MTQRVLRPLTLGDLFDEAIDLYRDNFMLLVGIAGLVYIPLAVLMAFVGWTLFQALDTIWEPSSALNPFQSLALQSPFWGLFGVAVVIAGILQILAVAATTWAVSSCYLGSRPTILASYKVVLPRIIPLICAAVLIYLMLAVGLVMCVLPGVIVLILTSFVSEVLILENKGCVESIKRSFVLASSSWGRILLVGVISALLMWVVSLLINLPFQVLAMALSHPAGLAMAISTIMRGIASAIVAPIITVAFVLLYYDVRVRREGFDIAMLAASMGSGEQTATPQI